MAISLHPQTLRRFAARSELLHLLDDKGFVRLAKIGELRHVPAGDVIISEGELSYDLYLLAAGELQVRMKAAPGNELARLQEGAFFGEIAFINRKPRTATVRTLVNCQIVRFGVEAIEAIFGDYPDLQAFIGGIGTTREQANTELLARTSPGDGLPSVEAFLAGDFANEKTDDLQTFGRQTTPAPGTLPPSRRTPAKV